MNIVMLPVDARPAVREQVCDLVALSGAAASVPAKSALGYFRQPADRDALAEWLRRVAATANGLVLSLDMLVYGGLVPSRFIEGDAASLIVRLVLLREIKSAHPDKPIYAFTATMRLSNNNVNEEEKTYWDVYGERIWRWSFLTDRATVSQTATDQHAAYIAEQAVPENIRMDYLATRKRNFAVTVAALDLVQAGVIDRLILPQDDTAEYGFNIAERRQLQSIVTARGLRDKVAIYAGADEVAHTLCARMVHQCSAAAVCRFYLSYSDPANVSQLRARYEDRPIVDSLSAQIAAAGGMIVDSPDVADIYLLVHTSGVMQGDWAMRESLPVQMQTSPTWLTGAKAAMVRGQHVALVDLAYANGGDPVVIDALKDVFDLRELMAYAGWNTASNSIGNLVAQCVLQRVTANAKKQTGQKNQRVLCLRLLEDYLYQSVWRQHIRDALSVAGKCEHDMTADELQAFVAAKFIPAANDWLVREKFDFRVTHIELPWQRTFEIDIQLVTTT